MFCFPRFCRGSYTPHPIDTQWSYDPQINTTKMMLFSDEQEDSRWTDETLLEFDIYSCIVTDVVNALDPLHGRAPPDEEEDLNLILNKQL